MITIAIATTATLVQHSDEFCRLLRDSVENGASIGFVLPLSEEEVQAYWQKVHNDVVDGSVILLVALQNSKLIGSAQLGLESRANGNHRGEVRKVMVHSSARRQGIGRQLMDMLETVARQKQRTLLFLDTTLGDKAEQLYQSTGYTFVGGIPQYARLPDGTLHTNSIFYKLLA